MHLRTPILRLQALCTVLSVLTLPAQSQWEKVPTPTSSRILSLIRSGATLYAGTYGEGVYRSTDEGGTWSSIGPPGTYINCLAAQGGYLFAGTGSTLYRTSDTSIQWITCPAGPQYEYSSKANFTLLADGATLYTGTRNGVYRTTNHGDSWIDANTGITQRTVKALAKNGTDLFAAAWVGSPFFVTGAVHRTTDAGVQWTQQSTGTMFVNCFMKSGLHLFSGENYYGIKRSSDNGVTWSSANNGLPPNPSAQSFLLHGTLLVAGLSNGQVYHSSNNGNDWYSTGPGIPEGNVVAMAVGPVHLVAGTDSGIYRLPLASLIASVPPMALQPVSIILEQNYPNPFNPSTAVTYHLAAAGHVTLEVFDGVGRRAAVLTDAVQNAGVYTVQFNAGYLSSGMYFAVLRSNGYTAVRRMTLLR